MSHAVLLCDDEVSIVRPAALKFRLSGYEVACAHDGLDAWEQIGRKRPELLVTDYQMPRMNGAQLCDRIRAEQSLSGLPIILLTAKGSELSPTELQARWGILAVVWKPFSPRKLVQMADEWFATGKVDVPFGPVATPIY